MSVSFTDDNSPQKGKKNEITRNSVYSSEHEKGLDTEKEH